MSIVAAFVVPHPPLIVPAVGKGEERAIQPTIDAYEEVGRRIAEIAPQTIVITSPHATLYADYFHISPGKAAHGDLSNFRAKGGRIDVAYDTALVDAITHEAVEAGVPAGTLGERDARLDHATYIPLYFIEQAHTEGYQVVRIGLSGLSPLVHYRLGQCIARAVDKLDRRVVFVASGDLSHKLKVDGPYGFAPEGPEFDQRFMDAAGKADFLDFLDFDENFCEKAAECGLRSFQIMAGALDGRAVDTEVLNHEDITGVGYGVVCYDVIGDDDGRHFGDEYVKARQREAQKRRDDEDDYVRLARQSLETYIREGRRMKLPDELPAKLPDELLERQAGAFVSLKKEGRLRGCIGTIAPTQATLAAEIVKNAVSAGTEDPRFDPVTAGELDDLVYDVDVLGPMEDIASPDELDVRRYGVVVTSKGGFKRGLLLPDLEGVDSVEDQIDIARRKGGIRENEPYTLQRFEVVRHL